MEARFSVFGTEVEPLSSCKVEKNGFRVCVIGGGGTGAALAYDLSQRGFSVTLLEKGELTSGTTGRHHGQLHCGARYAWSDRNIARECYAESLVLSRIAGGCIEYNGGFFVALGEGEKALERKFVERCVDAGIPAAPIGVDSLRRLEPALSEKIVAAVAVPDGSFDAFRMAMMFFTAARRLGAEILPWHEATGFDIAGGRLRAVIAKDLSISPHREFSIGTDFVISATGAWAGEIGRLAGVSIPITPAPGTMVAFKGRLIDHVVSRLRPPGDGDILVPQRGLSIIGSTQRRADSPEDLLPEPAEIEFLRAAASEMAPAFGAMPIHAAWAAARPLAGAGKSGDAEGRFLSRDFRVLDHEAKDGIAGFATIIGGKATVLRAMAEKTADIVCGKFGLETGCRTESFRLPSWRLFHGGASL